MRILASLLYETTPPLTTSHLPPTSARFARVKHTVKVRIWRDWKGGVVGALLSFTIGLCLPESLMIVLYPLRYEVARLIATAACFTIMFFANYVEHVVQPPVEPKGITSFSGKSVFFTVTVIGNLLIYYSLALATQLLNLFNLPSQLLNHLTYHYFIPSYALGTMLSIFYYAGVLSDPDEKKNIERWHRRGVPLARYLHSTHSTSIFCVNVDLIFKNAELLNQHVPTMDSVVVTLYAYGVCYASWVLINYSQTGYFPYPFMNGMGNWQYPAFFLAIMANVAVIMGVLSCIWISQMKGCEMMSVASLLVVLVARAKALL